MKDDTAARDRLALARRTLLGPANLGERELEQLFGRLMQGSVDYADLYFQYSRHEAWSLEEGMVKSGSHNIECGVGVRAVAAEKQGLAYSDEIALPALIEATGAARAIARQGGQAKTAAAWHQAETRSLYAPLDPVASLADDAKVRLLECIELEARAADPCVKQVMADRKSTRLNSSH